MSKVLKKDDSLWHPLPPLPGRKTSSQQLFLACGMNIQNYIREVLYHGTRGGGKTETLLMSFALHVGKGYSQWRGVIFRKGYKALDDVIKKSKKLFPKIFGNRCKFLSSQADYKWVFETDYGTEELLFRAIENVSDYDDKYHGQEFQFIGWEELCSWKDLELYFLMMSCLRCSSDDLDNDNRPPLLVRSTTNPYGAGRSSVKRYFIDAGPSGSIIETVETIDEVEYKSKRMHIFSSWKENVYLNSDYPTSFSGIRYTNPNQYRAFVYGDWEAVSGGMFGDIWDYSDHVIPDFKIPEHLTIDRSMDYGTASPFSILFFAELDGLTTIVRQDGSKVTPPVGSLIIIDEIYGSKDLANVNVGLNLHPSKIAEMVKNKEENMRGDIISLFTEVIPGPADNSIWNDSKVRGLKTIADFMREPHGVEWTRSNKAKGSRITRVQVAKEMLMAAKNGDHSIPHLYVFKRCKFFINNFPALQIDEKNPEDVDTTQADHDWDACGYKLISKRRGKVTLSHSY